MSALPVWLERQVARLPVGREATGWALRWCWLLYQELERDRAFVRAAGMAYGTLVALVPLLVLVAGVVGAVLGDERDDALRLLLDPLLGDMPALVDELLAGVLHVDLRALGVLATGGLLVTAWRVYASVEAAYNDIFRVAAARSLTQRLLAFQAVATLLPVFLVALIGAWVDAGLNALTGSLVTALTYLLIVAALKLFPNTVVRWRPALVGGLVSLLLLEGGRAGFTYYVAHFVVDDPMRAFWGSLWLVPVFLLWLYLIWVSLLLGVEVAYVLQHFTSLVEAEQDAELLRSDRTPGLDDALRLAQAAVGAWRRDLALDPAGLATRAGLDGLTAGRVLRVLEGRVLLPTARGWAPVRDPATIPLQEVAAVWLEATGSPRQPPWLHLRGSLADEEAPDVGPSPG